MRAGMENAMIWRCAWCPQEPEPEGVEVTHGICAVHLAEVRAEHERLKAERARRDAA